MNSVTSGDVIGAGCDQVMTGDYLEQRVNAAPDDTVLVSVQVFPLVSLAAAEQAKEHDFVSGGNWDFGLYCPGSGLGSTACSGNYAGADKREWVIVYHRYLVEATAVNVNLSSGGVLLPYLNAAAHQAVRDCGPQNYP